MKAMDWLARTTMLVLAALATLALIGSLASVSDSSIGDAFPGEIAVPAEPATAARGTAPASDARLIDTDAGRMTIETPVTTFAPPPAERDVARWLKALTYAVLALAVLVAAGVVALVRIAGLLGRMVTR